MDQSLITATDFFYLLSDETRLRCLLLLKAKGELCVCDLTCTLGMSQPKISRHLAIMKKFNLLLDRRSKIWIYYTINPSLPSWIHEVLATSTKHVSFSEPYKTDINALNDNMQTPNCC